MVAAVTIVGADNNLQKISSKSGKTAAMAVAGAEAAVAAADVSVCAKNRDKEGGCCVPSLPKIIFVYV